MCRRWPNPARRRSNRSGRRGPVHARMMPSRYSRAIQGRKCRFPPSTCISLNEQVVHGIPGQRVIRDGDLLKIDTACKLNGWCADAAVTLPVGECQSGEASPGRSGRAGVADGDGGDGPAQMVVGGGLRRCSSAAETGRLQRGARSTSATASAASCTRIRRCRTSSAGRCGSTISVWKRGWCWPSSRW